MTTAIPRPNQNLHRARESRNDEFYTQRSDIDRELRHYAHHFAGKVVFCNCDDPYVSNFFSYFAQNFEVLQLKKLITTCYKSQRWDIFSRHDSEKAISLEYNGDLNNNRVPNPDDIGINHLQSDGDFRSKECTALLHGVDVVSTNPPFSLFREYVAQLVAHKKKFLIIGNFNAVTYKEIFQLIKTNQIWIGASPRGMNFNRPDGTLNSVNACWYTNLDIPKRHEEFVLYKKYNTNEYPRYDNYDAIDVSKTSDIPMDYDGVMGVPITFLDKYNPDQFEIIAFDYEIKQGLFKELVNPNWEGKLDRGYINGKRLYSRILIRNREV